MFVFVCALVVVTRVHFSNDCWTLTIDDFSSCLLSINYDAPICSFLFLFHCLSLALALAHLLASFTVSFSFKINFAVVWPEVISIFNGIEKNWPKLVYLRNAHD